MTVDLEFDFDQWEESSIDADSSKELESVFTGKEEYAPFITRKNIFTHHDSHPLVMAELLFKEYGKDWLDWDADALWITLAREFGTYPSSLNKNQIQAVRTLFANNSAWTQWEVFNPVFLSLTNNIPIFAMLDPLSIPQLYCGWDIASMIVKPRVNEELARYMAALFHKEAVYYAPPPLNFLQALISVPMYKCPDCGLVAEVTDTDDLCDQCSGRFTEGKLGFNPDPERLAVIQKTGEGSRCEYFLKYPYKEVQKRLNSFLKNPRQLDDEDAVDLQVGVLVSAKEFVLKRRLTALKQLKGLGLR